MNSILGSTYNKKEGLDLNFKKIFITGLCALSGLFSSCALNSNRISFDLEKDGNVSVGIYSGDGRMLRELTRAEPMKAGPHTIEWDGLDREGNALPPDKYTWKLLQSQGLEAEYLMTLGTSMGINAWPGVHGGPSAAIVSGDRMYMAGAGSETAMGIACSKLDGTFVWSNHGLSGWDSQFDLAVVGDKLWGQFPGDGSTRAASVTNGENLKLSMTHRLPLFALSLQGDAAPAPLGFTAFPVAAYTPERGYGWQTISNVSAFTRESGDPLERGGHQMSGLPTGTKPVFLVDLPKYVVYPGSQYSVRLHLGGGAVSTQDCDAVQITAQGKWKTTWKRDASPKADIASFTVDAIDKPLEIGFYTDQKDKTFGVSLSGIEIFALPNRMDADAKQMVIAAAGASKLLWVKPEGGNTPDYARLARVGNVQFYGEGSSGITTGQANPQSPMEGSTDRSGNVWYSSRETLDFDIDLPDGAAHQVSLYFAIGLVNGKERAVRTQVLNAADGKVLDTREAKSVLNGQYLVWNLKGHVILRLTGLVHGPFVNAVFFDPAAGGALTGQVAFVKSDTTTQGNWRGVYGRDGFTIAGDPTRVVDSAVVANVEDVALLGDGSVLAISGDRLVTLNRKEKTPVVRVTGLEKPAFLGVDKSKGDILVAQAGDSNQIIRFDRNFKKIATYGRAGGRKNGRYVPEDFAGISGVAADHQGGFLVTEWLSAPRRVAHFDKAGKLLREWYGGQMFYHSVGVDPEDPSRVWENSQFGNVMEMAVDYDKREWKVVSTWNLDTALNRELFPKPAGFWALVRPITLKQNGKRERYVCMEEASATVLKPDYENGRLVPVAAAGSVQRGAKLGSVAPPEGHPWRIAAERLMKEKGAPQSLLHYMAFGYVDANGDGQMQPEEFTIWGNRGQHGWGWVDIRTGGIIDAELNSWCFENSSWYRLVPTGLAPNGLPIWDMGKREVGPTLKGATIAHLWPTSDALYTLERREGDDFGRWWSQTYWEGHGYGWPGSMINATALVRRDRGGTKIVWESGPHHSGGPGARGRLDMPQRIAGVVNGCVGVTNQTRQPCEFWTEDGLYVGGLLDRRKADGLPDRVYSWWCADPEKGPTKPDNRALLNYDMGHSGVLAKRPNGDVLFYGAGWNNVPVFRINGWDTFKRQSGSVILGNSPKTAANGSGLSAEYFANPDLKGEPAVRRVDADVWFGYANKAKANGSKIPWPAPEITGKPFSVRWTGFVESRFSEETTFVFYARNSGVRLWIGEQLVIDQWDGGEKKAFGKPVLLEAGKKVPIKIEWRQLKPDPQAHLNWESLSEPIGHVPSRQLYALKEVNGRK
jgi:hypothetical protein